MQTTVVVLEICSRGHSKCPGAVVWPPEPFLKSTYGRDFVHIAPDQDTHAAGDGGSVSDASYSFGSRIYSTLVQPGLTRPGAPVFSTAPQRGGAFDLVALATVTSLLRVEPDVSGTGWYTPGPPARALQLRLGLARDMVCHLVVHNLVSDLRPLVEDMAQVFGFGRTARLLSEAAVELHDTHLVRHLPDGLISRAPGQAPHHITSLPAALLASPPSTPPTPPAGSCRRSCFE
jgi:hypothetical protein